MNLFGEQSAGIIAALGVLMHCVLIDVGLQSSLMVD